ncbi:TRAP transporter large permease subunit [Hoeflea sp. G2-23]|uniref:TRAP transporter large permease subunit n=1 Tax=Hoeflea algicola TaxID=2983763 RepID=A0ABT3Z694_9HYPH|nr:TRAP transporter large permease subunit [Hoeflea algicola]MCY0146826.1 TRAP transporter large permease subunit [Hoeflea algicola]
MIAQLAYYLPGMMFLALTGLLLTGFPVALTLGGTSIIFGLLGISAGIFSYAEFFNILPRIWGGLAENLVLVAAPMFVLMGSILERSGIAEDLLDSATHLSRKLPGGTAIAIILIGMVLGATTGVIAATVVMLTVFAVPAMLKQQYNKEFAAGTVAAAGTLGILIPPSIMLIFMGDILQVSVGKLFWVQLCPD